MNKAISWKTLKNVNKNTGSKPVTTEARRNYLISESNYHTTNFFSENLLAIEIKKMQLLMNKPVYLILSILEISKRIMCEFSYDYVKSKHGEKPKLFLYIHKNRWYL